MIGAENHGPVERNILQTTRVFTLIETIEIAQPDIKGNPDVAVENVTENAHGQR